ncbi:hypothetical protein B0H16DRAFT_1476467 [Mycena metata]|uniref:Uncharacterized protein n=1 Tax=Mycena metata TaxID=1033252 RepID=A0AAD7MHW8_9AGAR|nr:hypothetical protein B0H16DRAFT_1476467 [Mycena metata]
MDRPRNPALYPQELCETRNFSSFKGVLFSAYFFATQPVFRYLLSTEHPHRGPAGRRNIWIFQISPELELTITRPLDQDSIVLKSHCPPDPQENNMYHLDRRRDPGVLCYTGVAALVAQDAQQSLFFRLLTSLYFPLPGNKSLRHRLPSRRCLRHSLVGERYANFNWMFMFTAQLTPMFFFFPIHYFLMWFIASVAQDLTRSQGSPTDKILPDVVCLLGPAQYNGQTSYCTRMDWATDEGDSGVLFA